MISSALFHTFSCHSEQTHRSWQETDHFGIIWAMFGTYVPFLCQAFDCHYVSTCNLFNGVEYVAYNDVLLVIFNSKTFIPLGI